MNKCIYCSSDNLEVSERTESNVIETCNSCGKTITYNRIRVGRKSKQSYIEAINYALKLVKQDKIMVCAAGRKRLILLDVLYIVNLGVDVLEWKQQRTELGGLELSVILKMVEG